MNLSLEQWNLRLDKTLGETMVNLGSHQKILNPIKAKFFVHSKELLGITLYFFWTKRFGFSSTGLILA